MNKTPEELAVDWANGEGDLWFADISTYTDGHKSAVKQAYLAGYQTAQQWISVKDRLPALHEVVLVRVSTVHYPYFRLASLKLEQNEAADIGEYKVWREIDQYRLQDSDTGCFTWNNITHWMPLPAAPKEEV